MASPFGVIAGAIDRICGEPLPIVRVFGWYDSDSAPPLFLEVDGGRRVTPTTLFRYWRPDIVQVGASQRPFSGFIGEFLLSSGTRPVRIHTAYLAVPIPNGSEFGRVIPHYDGLLDTDQVLGREHIYGSGPPTDVPDEIKAFAARVSGDVLDFGCGNGDLVTWWRRQKSAKATGLELKSDRIEGHLKAEARPYVVLYDGGCPLPFEDGSFDCIFSSEVIEHVPNISSYVPEFHRVLRDNGQFLFTTPDISCIPSSFPTSSVPWHLLEGTHVNFFTAKSVTRMLAPCFNPVELLRFGGTSINGLYVPGSLGGVFKRISSATLQAG